MDDTTKLLAINLPIVAVLAVWINSWIKTLYADFKAEREEAKEERKQMLDAQYDLKERVARIEEHLLGDRSPTIHQRPTDPPAQ